MYETMVAWETMPTGPDQSAVNNDFATLWRAASKVVFSRTLDGVASERTLLKHTFEPDWVRSLKTTADADLMIGGPSLAGQALHAHGLVDEIRLFVHPDDRRRRAARVARRREDRAGAARRAAARLRRRRPALPRARASSTILVSSASSRSSSETAIDSVVVCGSAPPLASATTSVAAAR